MIAITAGTARAKAAAPEDVVRAINDHFKDIPPELHRYGGGEVTTYGETLSSDVVSREAIAREIMILFSTACYGPIIMCVLNNGFILSLTV